MERKDKGMRRGEGGMKVGDEGEEGTKVIGRGEEEKGELKKV